MQKMTVISYILAGLELGRSRYWTIIANIILYGIVSIALFFTVIGILALPGLYAGYTKFTLRVVRGDTIKLGDSLLTGFQDGLWWKMWLLILSFMGVGLAFVLLFLVYTFNATALEGALVMAGGADYVSSVLRGSDGAIAFLGFLVLFVLSLYLAIAWCLASTLLVDKGLMPIQAIRDSRARVHMLGFMTLFGLALCGILLDIVLGIIASGFDMGLIALTTSDPEMVHPAITAISEVFAGGLDLAAAPIVVMVFMTVYENAIGNPLPTRKA